MKRAEVYLFRLIISIIIWNFIRIVLMKISESYDEIIANRSTLHSLYEQLICLLNPSYKLPLSSSIGKIETEKYLSIVLVSPFYFLIALGCYCLCNLG